MRTDQFDYDLPRELIAQKPAEPRDASRLLVLRSDGGLDHRFFRDLPGYLEAGDLIVLNQTRVLRARLVGRKEPTGGRVEVLLLRPVATSSAGWSESWEWEALVRPGRRLRPGAELVFEGPAATPGAAVRRLYGRVTARTAAGGRVISFRPAVAGESFGGVVEALGEIPLPPYITRPLDDPERYQTVYSSAHGSVAAPTAGLHFTPGVLERLRDKGVAEARVTLHIGLDTFRPVREQNVEDHRMHSEWFEVPARTVQSVAACRDRGGKVVACGTTVVRTLEAAADPEAPGLVRPGCGRTTLFIYPGYRFRVVDRVLTNFHLPRSSLLMLTSAFGGTERIMAAYREAARMKYRFYSFGDAMLIFPGSPGRTDDDSGAERPAGEPSPESDGGGL